MVLRNLCGQAGLDQRLDIHVHITHMPPTLIINVPLHSQVLFIRAGVGDEAKGVVLRFVGEFTFLGVELRLRDAPVLQVETIIIGNEVERFISNS